MRADRREELQREDGGRRETRDERVGVGRWTGRTESPRVGVGARRPRQTELDPPTSESEWEARRGDHENGLTTSSPSRRNPCCRSSVQSVRHPEMSAARTMSASQIENPWSRWRSMAPRTSTGSRRTISRREKTSTRRASGFHPEFSRRCREVLLENLQGESSAPLHHRLSYELPSALAAHRLRVVVRVDQNIGINEGRALMQIVPRPTPASRIALPGGPYPGSARKPVVPGSAHRQPRPDSPGSADSVTSLSPRRAPAHGAGSPHRWKV